jgi:hypothetical protein
VPHNGEVILVDSVVLLGLVGLGVYAFLRALTRATGGRQSVASPGVWRTNHYDAKGVTRVVVQKISPGGTNILNEHVVSTIRLDDPEYDATFMAAMATARERRAVFESEDDS